MKNIKKLIITSLILVPSFLFAQTIIEWSEDFSDGDIIHNPTWTGTTYNFIVNNDYQLQSNADDTSRSYLSTPSEVFDNAVWEFWVRINYNPSSSNYSVVYIVSDRVDVSGDVNGYYVQIGNTADEVSLYKQQGSRKTKIIDGEDKILDTQPNILKIRVTRTSDGEFHLYRQRLAADGGFIDNDYVHEGSAVDNDVLGSKYFSLLVSNTKTTGKLYFFDDIKVKGEKLIDKTPPTWDNLTIIDNNKLLLEFSESIDVRNADFHINYDMGKPIDVSFSGDDTKLTLTFAKDFEKGKIYTLEVTGLTDLAGNALVNTIKEIGFIEEAEINDIIINEILFDNSDATSEYIEIYNRSNKVIDLANVFYGVRTATAFKPSNFFPPKTYLMPKTYLAFSREAEKLRSYFDVPEEANIIEVERWTALNNTGANLLIGTITSEGDTLFIDELTYDVKWHHSLIRNTKDVALERIHPDLPGDDPLSWHSAASEVRYGTPGYQNSQFKEIEDSSSFKEEKWVKIDPEVFSPDNDGIDDVCFIRYKTDTPGFVANVTVFNAVGSKVRQIASNAILSAEGFFTWDGLTDRDKNVNPGIYVLYFEMINNDSGVKKVEKHPIVVSAR